MTQGVAEVKLAKLKQGELERTVQTYFFIIIIVLILEMSYLRLGKI